MSYGYQQPGFRPPASLAGPAANPFASTSYPSNPPTAPASSFGTTYRPPYNQQPANPYPANPTFPSSTPFSGSSTYPNSAAFPSSSPYQPPSSFPTSGFQPASTAFNSYPNYSAPSTAPGTVAIRYTPGDEREGQTVMPLVHITNMNAYASKSTEELRFEDYMHNRARSKVAQPQAYHSGGFPANPFNANPAYPAPTNYPPATSPFAPAGSSPFAPTGASPFAPAANHGFGQQSANPFSAAAPYPAPTSNPFNSAAATNPFATGGSTSFPNVGASSSYGRPSSQAPSVFAPTPTANSFFANPAAQSHGFGPNSTTPSRTTMQQFPSSTQGFAPSQAPNPFASAASAFNLQSSAPSSFPTYSSLQPRPSTTPQSFGFTPQPAYPAAPSIDTQTMMQAYRDPVGLSWLFPQGVPEEYKRPQGSTSVLAPTTTVEQLLRNKPHVTSNLSAINLTERWKRNRERRTFSPVKAKSSVSPVRNEASVFSKKDFAPLRLEPRSDVQLSPTKPVQITVKAYTPEAVTHRVSLERSAKVSALVEQVSAWIRPKPSERVELVCKGRKLRPDEPVAGLEEEVTVIMESNREVLDQTILPKLTRPGYSTDPPLAVMSHMSLAELQRVRDFAVRNENGEIVFEGETNVAGLDLDAIVQIEPKAVVLYPEGTSKPQVGRGLNKSALVRLLNCQPKREQARVEFEAKVRKVCERNGAEFVSYAADTGEWIFRVAHF